MYPELELDYEPQEISIKDIYFFEKRYSIKLPEDYKSFLLKYNGATVKGGYIYRFKKEAYYTIYVGFKNFEALCDWQNLTEIAKKNNTENEIQYLKNKMLKIGETSSLDLCICYSKRNYGKIYYIDEPHEYEFHLLANSFDEFMNSFEIDQDYEE